MICLWKHQKQIHPKNFLMSSVMPLGEASYRFSRLIPTSMWVPQKPVNASSPQCFGSLGSVYIVTPDPVIARLPQFCKIQFNEQTEILIGTDFPAISMIKCKHNVINPLILLKFIIRYLTFHSYAVGPTAASLPPGAMSTLLDEDGVVQGKVSIYVDPVTHLTFSPSVHVRVKLVEE